MKPWYKVVTPREDLRDGRPLDASEFAVHLDHVRDGRAPSVYQQPDEFFERNFFTKNLRELSTQVVRRLSGVKVETSAVFNLSTQFGGGKTHALTLLFHLAEGGAAARKWKGVDTVLSAAKVAENPKAATAIFVGTEFDSLVGRGGGDGTPLRRTPWGEVAFQLGGAEAFRLVEKHEAEATAPGGDVLEKLFPPGRPTLILLDELMNYVSRNRKSGLGAQLYNFLQNLSEVARSRDNVVLAVSIPASELEMSAEDQSDFERFKKLLDRVGKAIVMSEEAETTEIIRRRLFEWGGAPKEAGETADEFAAWVEANKAQLPNWFPVDRAGEAIRASYPFHPALISVFERKWRALPRFQQTRGVLRLFALWVSRAYADGFKGAHKDSLITLGTAPLEDSTFRSALFEQLGESRLEAAVTTDIAGKDHAHALRLDAEGTADVKKGRLHRKIATAILFESNGGQLRAEATAPEVRLAVGEPGIEIGSIEQCLESLAEHCYFLGVEKNRYRFSFQPNLNKLLADRRASVPAAAIQAAVRGEIERVFSAGSRVDRVFFPQKSGDISDRPALTFVVLAPDQPASDPGTRKMIEDWTRESGSSSRTFKSGIVWCAAGEPDLLAEEARKLLAWRDIAEDDAEKLDESQRRQAAENVKKAERDLRESVWRTYNRLFLLAEDNSLRMTDLGLIHSSAAPSLVDLILGRLRQEDVVATSVSPTLLARNWPPALPEWSTKAVRDAFFASPRFPRLLNGDAIADTISRGLDAGLFAYVEKGADGGYSTFIYKQSRSALEIELDERVFLIRPQDAEAWLAAKKAPAPETAGASLSAPAASPAALPTDAPIAPSTPRQFVRDTLISTGESADPTAGANARSMRWAGEIPWQKWGLFFTKVLTRFSANGGLRIRVSVEIAPPDGVPASKIEETKVALRELGLDEKVEGA